MNVPDKNENDGNLSIPRALLNVFLLAVPTAVSYCSTTLTNSAAFAFVGSHTNETIQASHALGWSIGNILVLMIGLGLINGMDTLCPLAIGKGHPEYTFAYLIQALTVATAAMFFLIPLILFSKELLILCSLDDEISAGACLYLKVSFPALFFICIYEALRKFLIYHQQVLTQVIVSVLSIPIQVFFLWIFVGRLNMELTGAGLARSLTWMVCSSTLFTLTFIKRETFAWSKYIHPENDYNKVDIKVEKENDHNDNVQQHRQQDSTLEVTCDSWSKLSESYHKDTKSFDDVCQKNDGDRCPRDEPLALIQTEDRSICGDQNSTNTIVVDSALPVQIAQQSELSLSDGSEQIQVYEHWWEGLQDFLKIAIPAAFLCVFEWLSFEIQIIEAGFINSVELTALATCHSLSCLIYFVSLSVGVTVNSKVGQCMGRLQPQDGKTITKAGIIASFCIAGPIALVLSLSRTQIAHLFFSKSLLIQKSLANNFLCLALAVVLADSLHGIISGAVKALSLLWIGTIFDLVGLFGIMQAVGLVLAFRTPLKGQGFILGTAIGLYFVNICYVILLFVFVDWPKRAKYLVKQRRRRSHAGL